MLAVSLAVGLLFLSITVQLALEFGFDGVNLSLLHVARGAGRLVRIAGEISELISDTDNEGLRIGDEAFQML